MACYTSHLKNLLKEKEAEFERVTGLARKKATEKIMGLESDIEKIDEKMKEFVESLPEDDEEGVIESEG